MAELDVKIRNREVICSCDKCKFYAVLSTHPNGECFVTVEDNKLRELPLSIPAMTLWIDEQKQKHEDIHRKWMSQGS